MNYIKNNLNMHYEIIGEGTPVLLLHGLACDLNLMHGCMEPFFKTHPGFKRIYIDLPGMGKSTAPLEFASSDAILSVLIDFVTTIIGDESFIVAGASYGGYLSLGLTAKLSHQIQQVLLIVPMVVPDKTSRILPLAKDYIAVDYSFLHTLPSSEQAKFLQFITIANERTYHRFQTDVVSGLKRANQNFLAILDQNYALSFNIFNTLTTLSTHPDILILAGRQDLVVGYEDLYQLTKSIPRVSYHAIDKASHCLQIEQPEIFEALINNWLHN